MRNILGRVVIPTIKPFPTISKILMSKPLCILLHCHWCRQSFGTIQNAMLLPVTTAITPDLIKLWLSLEYKNLPSKGGTRHSICNLSFARHRRSIQPDQQRLLRRATFASQSLYIEDFVGKSLELPPRKTVQDARLAQKPYATQKSYQRQRRCGPKQSLEEVLCS